MKRKKGLQLQNWIAKYLEENGWIVHNQKPVSKMLTTEKGNIWISQRNDIFGCIDIIAKKKEEKTLWILATHDVNLERRVEKLKEIGWDYNVDCVELWQKKDKKIKIYRYDIFNQKFEEYGFIYRKKFFLLAS